MNLINRALAKRDFIRLAAEQDLWLKVWSEAFDSGSPNAPYFIHNYISCGDKILKLQHEYGLKPGCQLNWLDKLICLIW